MSNPLPLTIDFGTIPQTGQGYTPQELTDRLGVNGRIFTEQAFALFTTGATAPTSDTGPWAANGNTWYYYDSGTGSYVPFLVPQASLKFYVGSVAPDPTIYQFWIELTGGGEPLAVKTYYSGAWTDVYANTLGDYLTVAAFNAAIANYSTTAQMNAAIAAAVAAVEFPTYPAQGVATAQTVAIDGTPYKINFTSAPINPSPAPFDTTNRRYIAPADGIYQVSVATQIDNATGTPAGMEIGVALYKNGVFVGNGMADLDSTPSPNGDRWSPGFSGLVQVVATDYLEVFVTAEDGVDAGNITVTVAQFSINRVSD